MTYSQPAGYNLRIMDTINGLAPAARPWDMYLFIILLLVCLYFLQRYMYLIDEKLAQLSNNEPVETRKPWPFLVALLLGMFVFLYNVFSPVDMGFEISEWRAEWIVFFVAMITIFFMSYESIYFFGFKSGSIRTAIYLILLIPYFYAGMISGYLLVLLMAITILIYSFRYWKKTLTIK